ncbi:MAG: enoyl-CoA hydratase/isomerase family protein [Proteobacteria bacterium]|nr:enoyl-CoA hydratase/isomerase family protein [Pseudomonadota bacterium]
MTPATFETLLLDVPAEGVARITLNRPERGNAVVPELVRDGMAALDAIDAATDVRVVMVTGAGRNFCAGADLPGMKAYLDTDLTRLEEPYNARLLHPLTQRLAMLSVPTLAAVNGAATAGGFDLSLACDLRIAGEGSRFGETYITLGLAPGNGGSWFLPRLVGSGMAAELALTGDIIDAARALELGIVNRVVADATLMDAALELAARIAARPRKALIATKQLLRASWQSDLPGALATSYWVTAALQQTRDLREGVEAALEKRPPLYNRPAPAPAALPEQE